MTREEILRMTVGLKEVGDLDLITNVSVLERAHALPYRETLLAIAHLLETMYECFDYDKSPEFAEATAGKSEAVVAKMRSMNQAQHRTLLRRFGEAIINISTSDDISRLVSIDHHHYIDKMRALASCIPENVE